jgi:hypothetical protein
MDAEIISAAMQKLLGIGKVALNELAKQGNSRARPEARHLSAGNRGGGRVDLRALGGLCF